MADPLPRLFKDRLLAAGAGSAEPVTVISLVPGFYCSDRWPFWFMVKADRRGDLNLWGFSIWRNQPGYRTFGDLLANWVRNNPDAKVWPDTDRLGSSRKEFVRWFRSVTKVERPRAAGLASPRIDDLPQRAPSTAQAAPARHRH